ncbi:TraG family conjugative transposon ATPase [Olivibacter sp. 47]|uniref:TraG family conjugative transposon ATPase n=1 Tax=Olivibacter sp. 47 TaxID=3056486 RepID=UPI00338E206D
MVKMEKWLEEVLPIMDVEHNCIISKKGDITIGYRMELPELFTLVGEDYEALHQSWIKAIKVLPKHCVVHKQDWVIEKSFSYPHDNRSFLTDAAARHFNGRKYFDHTAYLFLTKKPEGRKPGSSMASHLIGPGIIPEQLINDRMLQEFSASCQQFRQIINDSGLASMQRLKDGDLLSTGKKAGIIERYCYLSEKEDSPIVKDIQIEGEEFKIGRQRVELYALSDAADLPSLSGSRITYDRFSTDRSSFSVGFASSLGLLLPCNHIYNQFIVLEDPQKTIVKLEKKRLRLQSLAAYSRENAIAWEATNAFLNEAIGQQRLPVKSHFNVIVWAENREELKDLRNQVTTAMSRIDASTKLETVGAAQLFWAGIPGNAADLPLNECFDTFAEQSACFLNVDTNYQSDPSGTGIRFCDRLSARPVFTDFFIGPRKKGITSNMGTLICGSSGGGKSMTTNHILHSLYNQGAHCVVVDIGASYRALCEMLGGYYFTYTEDDPIRFNPFYLPAGQVLDTEKKESLKALLVSLWKEENESFNRSEYVALSNAISGYYRLLASDKNIFPSFDTFYEYLRDTYRHTLEESRVKETRFDIDNFLYVLQPYYRGGEFDFLLNATENLDLLDQPFIVLELDNIKDHPTIFPVVTLTIVELFISKMRKLPGVLKVLTVDEAWKAIAKSGMAEFLKYAFKTIRKFNGIPMVITQELDDLISSEIIKEAIINNADIKILLDMRKFMNKFEKIQDTLGFSEKGRTQLLSVNRDNHEIFVDLGGQVMKVLRNELCPEEYYAFTTEGKERVEVIEYARKYGSMEEGIRHLVEDSKRKE